MSEAEISVTVLDAASMVTCRRVGGLTESVRILTASKFGKTQVGLLIVGGTSTPDRPEFSEFVFLELDDLDIDLVSAGEFEGGAHAVLGKYLGTMRGLVDVRLLELAVDLAVGKLPEGGQWYRERRGLHSEGLSRPAGD